MASYNDDDDEILSIVVDNGTGDIKAGFAGYDEPKAVIPTLTGTPKREIIMSGLETKDHYVGDEAQNKRDILSLHHPMRHGIVTDWDDMERVWQHIFHNELCVAPEEHNVLMTEVARNPYCNREKMTEIMFERFSVPAFFVESTGILSTYASGRGSVMTVDIGEGQAHVMNVYEGYSTPEAVQRVDFGGRDFTRALQDELRQRAYNVGDPSDELVVRDIKEKLCYVAPDYEQELRNAECGMTTEKQYVLPDGQVVTLNTERFCIPELLFRPSLIGKETKGIHELVYDCIQKCPIDIRRDMCANVCLVGGSSLFPGMAERLEKELRALSPPTMKVKVIAALERKNFPWIGGSIMASLSTFRSMWITKRDYDESGPAVVHKKCQTC